MDSASGLRAATISAQAFEIAKSSRISRVYLNGRFLGQHQTGVQRYARETLRELDALLAAGTARVESEFVLLAPEGTEFPPLQAIRVRHVGPFSGHLWEQLTLPWASRDGLLWSFCATGPLVRKQQAVTIHDATVRVIPKAYSWKFRAWYELTMPYLARNSTVMTVSEFSRREVARHFGADANAVTVSGEGWQHISRVERDDRILTQHRLTKGRYVLAVSSVTPHKNFAVIERAIEHLAGDDYTVVIAGQINPRIFGRLASSSGGRVKMVGYVSNGELRALYENAGVFVYPSLYEGFGLPPLEAMAHGCPVISSGVASMPEVCADGALYFSPSDDKHLASLIKRVMTDPVEREALIARGKAQLERHSWQAAARNHLRAIEASLAAAPVQEPDSELDAMSIALASER